MNRMFHSLKNYNYRLWAAGALVSNVGTWLQTVAASIFVFALPNQTKPASQPGIAQRAVDRHRLFEDSLCLIYFVLSAQQKTKKRRCGRIARGKLHPFFKRGLRLWNATKAKM